MISKQVRYTVHAEYAEQNKANISRVMAELRALGWADINYSVFVEDDGKTFIHRIISANEEAHQRFGALASFKAFQAGLQGNGFAVPPTTTDLTLVGSSRDLL
jgi:hypothetical protein